MSKLLSASDSIAAMASVASAINCTIYADETNANVDNPKVLYQGQLANTPTALYTPGGSKWTGAIGIELFNTTAASVIVSFYTNGLLAANQTSRLTLVALGSAEYTANSGFLNKDATGALLTTNTSATANKNYAARVYARMKWK